jgi:hypothetical protein
MPAFVAPTFVAPRYPSPPSEPTTQRPTRFSQISQIAPSLNFPVTEEKVEVDEAPVEAPVKVEAPVEEEVVAPVQVEAPVEEVVEEVVAPVEEVEAPVEEVLVEEKVESLVEEVVDDLTNPYEVFASHINTVLDLELSGNVTYQLEHLMEAKMTMETIETEVEPLRFNSICERLDHLISMKTMLANIGDDVL